MYSTSIVNAKRHLVICKNILAPLANKSRIASNSRQHGHIKNVPNIVLTTQLRRYDFLLLEIRATGVQITSGIRRVAPLYTIRRARHEKPIKTSS